MTITQTAQTISGQLSNCIKSLRDASGKPDKFAHLENKMNDRLMLCFSVNLGAIGNIVIGMDNHHNHQRPHVHAKTNAGRVSIAIDNGEILHKKPKRVDNHSLSQIKNWVLLKNECLKFIYQNIQKIKSSKDFEPLIHALNKYL